MEWLLENVDRIGAFGLLVFFIVSLHFRKFVHGRELDRCEEALAKALQERDEFKDTLFRTVGLVEQSMNKKD